MHIRRRGVVVGMARTATPLFPRMRNLGVRWSHNPARSAPPALARQFLHRISLTPAG